MNTTTEFNRYAIRWDEIAIDPIGRFYKHIEKMVEPICVDFIESLIKVNRIDLEQINQNQEVISNLNQVLNAEFKGRNIKSIKRKNLAMKASFFLLFGLVFWKKVKQNNAILKEWKSYSQSRLAEIQNQKLAIKQQLEQLLSITKIKDLVFFIFRQLGIPIGEALPLDVAELIGAVNPAMIDIKNVIQGRLKNNPFYDFVYRDLTFSPVVTSRSMSFPYTVTIDGRRVTQYEVLTASHSEPTPFIGQYNVLVTKTNYEPELRFKLFLSKKWKKKDPLYRLIENEQFKAKFQITCPNLNLMEQKIIQQFSIKAQENFLNWSEINLQMGSIEKTAKQTLLAATSDPDKLELATLLEMPLVQFFNLSTEDNLTILKAKLIGLSKVYFQAFAKNAQLPLLLPSFSREWYRPDGPYLIANQGPVYDLATEKSNLNQIINQYLDKKFYFFNRLNAPPSRPLYFKKFDVKEIQANLFVGFYQLNSFYAEQKVAYVTVYGINVGPRIIPVPYTQHNPWNEDKKIIYLKQFHTKMNFEIIASSVLNLNQSQKIYQKAEQGAFLVANQIYCSDPKAFETANFSEELLIILKNFRNLTASFANQCNLVINSHGLSITINEPTLITPEIEQRLISDVVFKWKALAY